MQMNQDMNELLVKQQHEKIKKSGNQFLIGFFLVFMIGYFLFFTSKIWLPPAYEDIEVTPLGVEIEKNNRSVILHRWDYCEETKTQEIILEISNKGTDGINRYQWTLLERNYGYMDIKAVVEEKDLVVLHVTNLHPRWTELSLRMDADGVEEFESLKLYTTKRDVALKDSITLQSENEYRIEICDEKIAAYEKEIEQRLEAIADQDNVMDNGESRIKELKARQTYETDEEKKKTSEDITKLYNEVSYAKSEKERLQSEIREYREKIELQIKKKNEL